MARKFRKIDPRFWWDEKVMRLDTMGKLIALYVLTSPNSNRIGLYRLSVSAAADELGLSLETFRERFANVCQTLGWGFDNVVSVVHLPNWWEYNAPENPNVLRGNLADIEELPETELFQAFTRVLQPIASALGVTLPKRLANVTETFGKSGAGAGAITGAGAEAGSGDFSDTLENITKPAKTSQQLFAEFMTLYPNKQREDVARRHWNSVALTEGVHGMEKIVELAKRWVPYWETRDPNFEQAAVNWLSERRWMEPPPQPSKKKGEEKKQGNADRAREKLKQMGID